MNRYPITGLDGTEPIGFLAAVGTLRLLDRVSNAAKIGWQESGGGWHPYFEAANLECSHDNLAMQISQSLHILTESGEFGIAHIGDKIGVDRDVFRLHATRAVASFDAARHQDGLVQDDAVMTAALLSSGASDALVEKNGTVSVTALSFSNGASGQLLLKDFLTAAHLCTPERLTGTFKGEPVMENITSLNWDPKDQRAAAHRWRDPATEKQDVDPGINALAYLGMSYFTAVPGQRLQTLGWCHTRPRGLVWPLWEHPVSSDVVATCIAHVLTTANPEAVGVREVRFARVTNPDRKRNYFAPSRIRS